MHAVEPHHGPQAPAQGQQGPGREAHGQERRRGQRGGHSGRPVRCTIQARRVPAGMIRCILYNINIIYSYMLYTYMLYTSHIPHYLLFAV